MPFGFRRKSSSPDVIRMRDSNRDISGRKIPSLTELDRFSDSNNDRSRFSFGSNGGSSFSTFRSGIPVSVSSPNLTDHPTKRKSFETNSGDPNVCPICNVPFSDERESRVPRILPCLHTICTGCLQRAENFLVFLSKNQNRNQNRTTRYSWRRRSTRALLGNFVCPFCHGSTSIFLIEGVRALPINRFVKAMQTKDPEDPFIGSCNRQR